MKGFRQKVRMERMVNGYSKPIDYYGHSEYIRLVRWFMKITR